MSSAPGAETAFQDFYGDDFAHCFGCGRLNEQGHHLRSFWNGSESVATFTPEPHHIALPGYVYGGLIASLIDCHGVGTASAVATAAAGIEGEPALRFVTAALHVDYLRPTPLGATLNLRGHVIERSKRKVVVQVELHAADELRARGKVVAVRMPEGMAPEA